MTPQERDLITALLDRLKQAGQGGQPKDPEAETLIRRAVQEQPDASYYLVQTVLIQDMALNNAQGRIADLERQLAAAKAAQPQQQTAAPGGSGSFLGGAVPSAGPWGPAPRAARPSGGYQQPVPPAQAQQQSWGGQQPMGGPGMPYASAPGAMGGMFGGGGGGGGGFLRSAAATAAGVAGGALLFQGIGALFGGQHGGGGMLSDAAHQPGISETVINNYYGDQPAPAGQDYQTANWEQGGGADPANYASDDPGLDPGQDFASNDDLGGGSDDDFV
jgi:hypothetical protein